VPSSFLVQRGRPRRVSSIPSTCGAADSTGRRLGVRDEGRARDRPAHRQLCGHRRHRTARPDRHSSGPSGPAGDPSPGRQLRDRLGERLALAQPLPAGELPLVPAHHQRRVAVGQVLGTGGAPLPHHRGEHPALRARRRVRIGRTQVHRPGPVPVSHYPVHPNAGQAEKDRPTVLHARGSVPLPGFVVDALAQHLAKSPAGDDGRAFQADKGGPTLRATLKRPMGFHAATGWSAPGHAEATCGITTPRSSSTARSPSRSCRNVSGTRRPRRHCAPAPTSCRARTSAPTASWS